MGTNIEMRIQNDFGPIVVGVAMVFTTVCFIPLSFSLLTYLAYQFPNFWSWILLLIKLTLTGLMQIGLMVAGFVIFYGKFFINISVLKVMVIRVVEFSSEGYKIRKVFA